MGRGRDDPVYSDCGATVLANYEQTKISAPPNLLEPIGFDQFPDGRMVQTARARHRASSQPDTGTTRLSTRRHSLPTGKRLYTNSEDGLYGPAVDNNFATNHWIYLYYSPQTVVDVKLLGRHRRHADHADHELTEHRAVEDRVGPVGGLLPAVPVQVRRRRPGVPAQIDLSSEQQIMKVSNNRQECCHVAGDIDFDKHNNLWLVTGDDSPAGGVEAAATGSSTTS